MMNAKRLLKLIVTRWWLIALVALAGASTGFLVGRWTNSQIEATYEAAAPVPVIQTVGESDDTYTERLGVLATRAEITLAIEIAEAPGVYDVRAEPTLDRLDFAARNGDPDTARDLAEGLRTRFLSLELIPGTVAALELQLAEVEQELLDLRAQRNELTTGNPIDPTVAVQISLMESQLASLRQRLAELTLGITYPQLGTALDTEGNPRTAADIRPQLGALQSLIVQLTEDLVELRTDSLEIEGVDEETSLEILVLDQKIRDKESQYLEIRFRLEEEALGIDAATAEDETILKDITAAPTSPLRAGGLGLILGVVLASAVVLTVDRARRPIFGIEDDLAIPTLASVDPGRPGATMDGPWYPDAPGTRRRADVQALRASVDNAMEGGSISIGISGLGASDAAVHELAADLSTSIAASGRGVLLVDADFANPSDLPEYGVTGSALADIVASAMDTESGREDLKLALGDRDEVIPELLAVRAGHLDSDPVDAVAGRRFRDLLEVARDFVEVTIVATPHWGHPATDVLSQRVDHILFVGRTGVTTADELTDAASQLSMRFARPAGLVLLSKGSLFGSGGATRPRQHHASTKTSSNRRPGVMAVDPADDLATSPGTTDPSDQSDDDSPGRDRAATLADAEWQPAPVEPETLEDDPFEDEPEPSLESLTEHPAASLATAAEAPAAEAAPAGVGLDDIGTPSGAPDVAKPARASAPTEREVDSQPPPIPEAPVAFAANPPERARRTSWIRRRKQPAVVASEPVVHRDPDAALDSNRDLEPGEALLIERTVALLTHGSGNPPLSGHPRGALQLDPASNFTAAAVVLYANVIEGEQKRSRKLDASLRRVIGTDLVEAMRDEIVAALDWWLRHRLVAAQSRVSDEPLVWHLSSGDGTYQALVHAATFDRERAVVLRSTVRRALERLRIDLWRRSEDQPDDATDIRTQIAEVEDFDLALHELSQGLSRGPITQLELDRAGVLSPRHGDDQ